MAHRTYAAIVFGAVALAAAHASAQSAQSYPTRPIRLIVPQSAGGVTDIVARAVAQRLSEAFGQQVVVENKPGANYQIGTAQVAKAEPDGHTLLVTSEAFTINPLISNTLPYDSAKDLAPITNLIIINHALITHPKLPANSVQDLIALAKRQPGELNYGTYGYASTGHLNMEMFQAAAGVKLTPVHYKGAAPALTDVLAGHIPMMFISVGSIIDPWRSGALKMLALGSPQRMAQLPEIPTMAESGLPGFRAQTWFGLFTTGGTPREVIAKINGAVQRIFADPEFRSRYLGPQMFEPVTGSPEQFAAFLAAERERWSKVIAEAKLKGE